MSKISMFLGLLFFLLICNPQGLGATVGNKLYDSELETIKPTVLTQVYTDSKSLSKEKNFWSSEIFIGLTSGIVGSIAGAYIAGNYALKAIKKEKLYYIELEVVTDKILNPLVTIYLELQKRRQFKTKTLVPPEKYNEIDEIFKKNICWLFTVNSNLYPLILEVKKLSEQNKDNELYDKMEELYNLVGQIFHNKYKA